jgi:hypothetical protein
MQAHANIHPAGLEVAFALLEDHGPTLAPPNGEAIKESLAVATNLMAPRYLRFSDLCDDARASPIERRIEVVTETREESLEVPGRMVGGIVALPMIVDLHDAGWSPMPRLAEPDPELQMTVELEQEMP